MEFTDYYGQQDLNLIENVWALLKNRLRRQWRNPYKRPHNERELTPYRSCASKMPIRVLTVIRRGGRSTHEVMYVVIGS